MKICVILSIIFRTVMVLDYGNPKIPNYCEKHFLSCPKSLERSDDCEYFLDHRCKYLYKRVDRLKRPVLYRRDHYDFTRYEGDLPYYRCLTVDHLKLSWKRELKYEGNRKTKWIVMVPSRAFPLDVLKRTFIQVDNTLPEKALWETENISDFNEFVYKYDEPIMCDENRTSLQIKDIDGRHMAEEEFDLSDDWKKYYDLRMITVVVIKDNQQSCVRIHPKYSNHNQQSNVVTYVVGSELAYPTYDRIANSSSSPPPWADDDLRHRDSAWCRSQRFILGLSEADIISKEGQKVDLTGPHYCSLFLWEQERVIRLTFKHNNQMYTVKVVLQVQEDHKSWTPMNIGLYHKQELGQVQLGDTVHFQLQQEEFTKNETFYSMEPELVLGNDEMKIRINRLGVEFDPRESPFNFSVPFHNKRSTLSIATPLHTVGKSKCHTRSSYPTGGFGQGHPGFGPQPPELGDASPTPSDGKGGKSTKQDADAARQERYRAVGKRAKFVLLPFLLAVFLLALIVTVLRFAHRLRNWLYDKLVAPVAGKRARPAPAAPLSALQRAALAAQYARAQAANLAVYTLEGAAIVAALRTLCNVRDRLLAAACRAPPAVCR